MIDIDCTLYIVSDIIGSPQTRLVPHNGGVGVNSQVGECLVGYTIRGEGHWKKNLLGIREVERLTRNPAKLANAGDRCWKDTL